LIDEINSDNGRMIKKIKRYMYEKVFVHFNEKIYTNETGMAGAYFRIHLPA